MQNAFYLKDGRIYQLDDLLAMGIIQTPTPEPQPKPQPEPEPSPDPVPEPLPQESYVEIGGINYRTTVIGNREWLAENLQYVGDDGGIPIGSDGKCYTVPRAAYYNDNSETYGNYGLMYNWYAVKYIDDHKDTLLPAGWRVPTHEDMLALEEIVGLYRGKFAGYKLKSVDGWMPSDGTDEFRFTWLPGGFGSTSSDPLESDTVNFRDEGEFAYLWQLDEDKDEDKDTTDYAYVLHPDMGSNASEKKRCYHYLRLVRDVT